MTYWERRQAEAMVGYMQTAEDAAAEIARAYEASAAYMNGQLEGIFQRFAGQYGLSDASARRILRQVKDLRSLDSLRSAVEASGENADELLAEMNSPAYAARMRRWEDMQESLDDVMRNVYGYERGQNEACYRDIAGRAYTDTIEGVEEQVGFGFSFAQVNPEEIDTVMNTPFLGANYSQRIWGNTQAVADSVREELLVGVMTGKSEREMAQAITERFGVGASNARRLIRTESAFVSGEMQARAYEECGAEKYEFVAVLDMRTSEICQKLDGKVFELKDKEVGVNYPPMHPYCRSTTIIHLDDDVEEELEGRRIARNPETGRNEYVPADMTYEEWEADQREQYGDEAINQARREAATSRYTPSNQEQFERYRNVLGNRAGNTFEEFMDIKYNRPEEWADLKRRYRVVNSYEMNAGSMTPEQIYDLDRDAFHTKQEFTGKARRQANMAIMELDGEVYYGNSQANGMTDAAYYNFQGDRLRLVLQTKDPLFTTTVVGSHLRDIDSEAKLLEYAARIAQDGQPHTINLLSEKCMCESCRGVLQQFEGMFPNVQINVVSNRADRAATNRNRPWFYRGRR